MAIVQQAFAAFQQGDIQTGLNLYAEDIKWQLPGPREILPWASIHRGREQVQQVLGRMAELVEFEPWEPRGAALKLARLRVFDLLRPTTD